MCTYFSDYEQVELRVLRLGRVNLFFIIFYIF